MTSSEQPQLVDQQARQQALDPSLSCVVQAPAGSGKTGLLIQRYLALLPLVEEPEEIVALTFTRKAATEMRQRIQVALESARGSQVPRSAHDRATWMLARRALDRDEERGWQLQWSGHRIQARTIDSLCESVVRQRPLASQLGGRPQTVDDPRLLFEEAVRRVLRAGDPEVATVLWHLDNDLPALRRLLVAMLGRRDQWQRQLLHEDLPALRKALEQALADEIEGHLEDLEQQTPSFFRSEVPRLLLHARAQLDQPLPNQSWPGTSSDAREHWQAFADLVCTTAGSLRSPRGINKRLGFPVTTDEDRALKQDLQDLLAKLSDSAHSSFVDLLVATRHLPTAVYEEEQWQLIQELRRLLGRLLEQLEDVFRDEGRVDHGQVTAAAIRSLARSAPPLRHLLVDEFQDTSVTQLRLIQLLTQGWTGDDGRTLFLVGDPMQSIYRFREADVGIYLRTRQRGLSRIRLTPLQLSTNFRSTAAVLQFVDECFTTVFPDHEDADLGAVPYAASVPHDQRTDRGVEFHCWYQDARLEEAERVVEILSEREEGESAALLARSRHHLDAILPELRRAGIPYRAVEFESLAERPIVRDLRALTQILLCPADGAAWLAVLRSPSCGLSLRDLAAWVESSPAPSTADPLTRGLDDPEVLRQLTDDGRARVLRLWRTVEDFLKQRRRRSLRRSVEGLWLALGGAATVQEEAVADAEMFLQLLQELERGGDIPAPGLLDERLERLYARPDADGAGAVEVMTIHKAKGLEFDRVVVPGLGRAPRRGGAPLLAWQERLADDAVDPTLLLAPIRSRRRPRGDHDSIFSYLQRLDAAKETYELQRLLYVAFTRARRSLHLLGHVVESASGGYRAHSGSAMDALGSHVIDRFIKAAGTPGEIQPLPQPQQPAIRRLRRDWQLAPLAEAAGSVQPPRSSTQPEVTVVDGGDADRRRAAAVGTVVHRLLQTISDQGVEAWDRARVAGRRDAVEAALRASGLQSGLPAAAADVLEMVAAAIEDSQGRWTLEARADAASEIEFAAHLDGEPLTVRIDRTFIDDGDRWIVDYKTSRRRKAPGDLFAEEDLDSFLAREVASHRGQLELYRRVLAAREPQRRVRAGLYFLRERVWCEVTASGSEGRTL